MQLIYCNLYSLACRSLQQRPWLRHVRIDVEVSVAKSSGDFLAQRQEDETNLDLDLLLLFYFSDCGQLFGLVHIHYEPCYYLLHRNHWLMHISLTNFLARFSGG